MLVHKCINEEAWTPWCMRAHIHISFCKFLLVNIQHPLAVASHLSFILFDILLSSDLGVCFIWSSCWMRLPAHTLSRSLISPSCQGAICSLKLAVALPVRRPWCFFRNFFLYPLPPCVRGVCSALRGREQGAFQHSFYASGPLKYSLLWSFCDSVSSGACQLWAAYWDECIQKEKRSEKKGFLYDWQRIAHSMVEAIFIFLQRAVENTSWWIHKWIQFLLF